MLCDELAHDELMRSCIQGSAQYQRAILASEKFVLGPDFALAADGLVENYKELERIAPWCRLPHPLCWFEVSHADRELWKARSTFHFPEEQFPPSRVGYLLKQKGDNAADFDAYLFWSLTDFTNNGGRHNMSDGMVHYDFTRTPVPDTEELPVDPKFPMYEGRTHLGCYVDLGMARISRMFRDIKVTPEHVADLVRSDWAGEIRYIIAILGLINAKNVYETGDPIYRNLDKMNKKRVQQGKHPLAPHTLLKIRAIHKDSLVNRRAGTATEIRGRFVRGHFKTRKTGIFWWSRHWRGPHDNPAEPRPYKVVT